MRGGDLAVSLRRHRHENGSRQGSRVQALLQKSARFRIFGFFLSKSACFPLQIRQKSHNFPSIRTISSSTRDFCRFFLIFSRDFSLFSLYIFKKCLFSGNFRRKVLIFVFRVLGLGNPDGKMKNYLHPCNTRLLWCPSFEKSA